MASTATFPDIDLSTTDQVAQPGDTDKLPSRNIGGVLAQVYQLGQCCAMTRDHHSPSRRCMNFVDTDGFLTDGDNLGDGLCSVHLSMFRDLVLYKISCGRVSLENHELFLETAVHFMCDLKHPDLRTKRNRTWFMNTQEGKRIIALLKEIDPTFIPCYTTAFRKSQLASYEAFCAKYHLQQALDGMTFL